MIQELPIIIGVSGISGAGKSTLIRKLADTLQSTFIIWDDFDEISQIPALFHKLERNLRPLKNNIR